TATSGFGPGIYLDSSSMTGGRKWSIFTSGASDLVGASGVFHIYDVTVDTARVTINNSGNVGIGTTSPQRTLDLGTSGQLTFGNNGYSSNGSPGFFWYVDNVNYGIYKSAGTW